MFYFLTASFVKIGQLDLGVLNATYFTIFVDLQGIMAFLVLLFTDFWI